MDCYSYEEARNKFILFFIRDVEHNLLVCLEQLWSLEESKSLSPKCRPRIKNILTSDFFGHTDPQLTVSLMLK